MTVRTFSVDGVDSRFYCVLENLTTYANKDQLDIQQNNCGTDFWYIIKTN